MRTIDMKLSTILATMALLASTAARAESAFPNSVPGTIRSGVGGTSALTLGTTVTTNAISAPALPGRHSLLVYNQSATASATFCTVTSGITPAPNVAGCYTLNPNGGSLSYPASGYVPQDAYNASASAAGTNITVEQH